MLYRLAILNIVLAAAGVDEKPPCKKSIFDDNTTKCIVEERADLPNFLDDADYEVIYCSHPVHGSGITEISKLMGLVHSSICFRERNGTAVFSFEFWALHFTPSGVLIPAVENGTLEWNSEGIVTWASAISREVWPHQVSLGFASGKVLNRFMDWVLQWHESHRYYQMFAVWNQPELGPKVQRYFDDTTCNTFTEDGLTELHRLGVPMTSTELLCRTYVVFHAAEPIKPINHFSVKRVEVFAYYDALSTLFSKFKNMNVRRALELIGLAIMEKASPFAFVYHREEHTYYKASLQRPYLEMWPMYLSQRMVLPWQPVEEAHTKECDPWSASHRNTVVV